jgi:hypothetical protein
MPTAAHLCCTALRISLSLKCRDNHQHEPGALGLADTPPHDVQCGQDIDLTFPSAPWKTCAAGCAASLGTMRRQTRTRIVSARCPSSSGKTMSSGDPPHRVAATQRTMEAAGTHCRRALPRAFGPLSNDAHVARSSSSQHTSFAGLHLTCMRSQQAV